VDVKSYFPNLNAVPKVGDIMKMDDGNYWRVSRTSPTYCVMYRVPWYKNRWWRLKDWFYKPFDK
jgi:hypothetical protein